MNNKAIESTNKIYGLTKKDLDKAFKSFEEDVEKEVKKYNRMFNSRNESLYDNLLKIFKK